MLLEVRKSRKLSFGESFTAAQKMKKHIPRIIALVTLGVAPFVSAQSIYRCTDANGEIHFTNTKTDGKCRNLSAEAEKSKADDKKERRKLIGKTTSELKKIASEPDRIVESVSAAGTVEKWMYKYQTIVIVNGKVTEVITVD